jgi:hypothetical protein
MQSKAIFRIKFYTDLIFFMVEHEYDFRTIQNISSRFLAIANNSSIVSTGWDSCICVKQGVQDGTAVPV